MLDVDCLELSKERGIDIKLFYWLREQKLIGMQSGKVAFPVFGTPGTVLGCQVRYDKANRKWGYEWISDDDTPQRVTPFVIGDPNTANRIYVFESTWDALAIAALYRLHSDQIARSALTFVSTRGAGNARQVQGLFTGKAPIYEFRQNDQSRANGKPNAAEQWLAGIARHAGCQVLHLRTPEAHKDANDWLKAGATLPEVEEALMQSVAVPPPTPRASVNVVDYPGWDDTDEKEDIGAANFPTQLLPPVYADLIADVARVNQVPEALPGATMIGVISGSLGRNLEVELLPGKITRPNVYIMIGALSGHGKSECSRPIMAPLWEFDKSLKDDWKTSTLPKLISRKEYLTAENKTIQKLIKPNLTPGNAKELNDKMTAIATELHRIEDQMDEPTMLVEDVTVQELAVILMKNDETSMLISSDGGDFVNNVLGRYNSLGRTDETILVKCFI